MNTLYISDLDGTLLGDDGQLSDYTKKTLNALIAHGLPFTVNTSRSPESARKVLSGLHLKLPAILMNGSCFYDFQKNTAVSLTPVPKNAVASVVKKLSDCGLSPFIFSLLNGDTAVKLYGVQNEYTKRFIADRAGYYPSVTTGTNIENADNIPYIVCVGSRQMCERGAAALRGIRGISHSLFSSEDGSYCFLEIYDAGAGKKNGAERFLKQYGFQQMVGFGDNLNDLEFIKHANIGVAVSNAHKELLSVADEVIGKNSENSVADYLLIEWSRRPELY